MGNVLTRNKALDELNILATKLSQQYDISYELNACLPISIAKAKYNNTGFIEKIEIGISEIYNTTKSIRHPMNPPVSDFNFARTILNTFHETAHYEQKNQLFRQKNLSNNEQKQLVQDIACMSSKEYYQMNGNYKINVNEIEAEHYGIYSAYNYLCEIFSDVPKETHEQTLLQVINYKMKNSTYFVNQDKPFESLDEVYNAFDTAYEQALQTKHLYFVNRDIDKDPIKQFMNEHPEAKDKYLTAKTPYEQDKCIAAIYLHSHPDMAKTYPALSYINLSYENVISKTDKPITYSRDAELDALLSHISNDSDEITDNSPDY